MVMPFSRSRSIESMTRSATSWLARNAPDCQSILSTSVVLPWSTWATIATFRRSVRMATGGPRCVRGTRRRRSGGGTSYGPEARVPAPGPGRRRLLGQHHPEGGAATGAVLHPGPAPVQLGEAGDEGQPDPRPGRADALRAPERLEDLLALLGRHPGPVVIHLQQDPVRGRRGGHLDRRALRGVAHRVHDEVLHDALDLRPVD